MSVNTSKKHRSGDIVWANSEMIHTVEVRGVPGEASPWEVRPFAINPGMRYSFPLLSNVGGNFTLYEFEGLVYEFRPLATDYTLGPGLGKVVMVTNYDPTDPQFSTSLEAENYDYSCVGKPTQPMRHGVETHPDQMVNKMMYIRTGHTEKDKMNTDLGLFQVGTEGLTIPAGGVAVIGEIWAHYKVRFSRVQLHGSVLGDSILTDTLFGNGPFDSGTIHSTTQDALNAGTIVDAAKFKPVYRTNGMAEKLTNGLGCWCIGTGAHNTSDNMILFFPARVTSGTFIITMAGSSPGTYVSPQKSWMSINTVHASSSGVELVSCQQLGGAGAFTSPAPGADAGLTPDPSGNTLFVACIRVNSPDPASSAKVVLTFRAASGATSATTWLTVTAANSVAWS